MDPRQFEEYIIGRTLPRLAACTGKPAMASPVSAEQLMGTALHESGGLKYIVQIGGGPALGPYQHEPATHDDLWDNWLAYRTGMRDAVVKEFGARDSDRLVYDFAYATAMARLQYWRVREPLPELGDRPAMARYWKQYWNTERGRGSIAEFLDSWERWG